jgi:anti-sigma regulatory factor (Ser/Thr protein kinase)
MGHGAGNGQKTVDSLLAELTHFRGEDREQEDDIIPLTLERSKAGMTDRKSTLRPDPTGYNGNPRILADFTLPSEEGNERLAMEKVAGAIEELRPSELRLERLKTAVAEATMNAMEHGNKYRAEVPVEVQVEVVDRDLIVRITDSGSGAPPAKAGDVPDLEAKLGGAQTPRGWGMFLIARMVDEVRVSGYSDHHTIELVIRLEVGKDGN